MRYGMILPGGTPGQQVEQAVLAEECGWDGVFVFDTAYGVDAWSLLAAMAVRTHRVRLGTMLTPLPFRRPWKLASQVVTVDQLSDGRAILVVGIGALGPELPATGEVSGVRERAERLDDGIDLMRALWAGATNYQGRYYQYGIEDNDIVSAAQPVQQPIPIWVVGVWPRPRSMRRVLRCEGVIPQYQVEEREATADDLQALGSWLRDNGAAAGFDVIAEGKTPADDKAAAAEQVAPWAGAGATWWLENNWGSPAHSPERMAQVTARLKAGPPAP
ncbi:MAG: LLM class flavin-dependent oxidoreductase [Acidimicrobiales bacterium]